MFTTPGHKETNGQAERLVKTVTSMLVATWQQELEWDANLDLYKYALNVSHHHAVDAVPYVLWFGRAPRPLVELEDRADQRQGAWLWADRRAYAQATLAKSLAAVQDVRAVQLKVKGDMKRRHDANMKYVDLRVGDLCYKYNEAVPKRSEYLPAKRLFRHWTGPYFVTAVKGENATVLDDRKGTSVTVHRNLLRRYVYPLAGLQLLGERRHAYLSEVTAKRAVNGEVQYQGLWRSKSKTELDWLDEEDVPSHLVEEFDGRQLVSALAVGV